MVVALFLATRPVEARGPSTPQERDQAVRLVHLLEADPLASKARDARTWLVTWLAEVPDITVAMCTGLLGPDFDSHGKFASELAVQQALSSAAFKIEHPDEAADDIAVNTAAVSGVLLAYESVLKQHPKAKQKSLDALIAARESGSLRARVVELSKSCH